MYGQMKPLIMQGDPVAIEVWNRVVSNSGEPQSEKLLYDPKQGPEMMQKAMQMAIQKFNMESKMKAKAEGEKMLSKQAAKEIIKHLSEAAKMQLGGGNEAEADVNPPPQPVGVNGQ